MSIEIRTEVFKVPIPVSVDFLSVFSHDLPKVIETVTGEVNSEVFARSLLVTGILVTGIEVTPEGISARIEKYPG